jgi:SH3 domain protein
LVSKQKGGNLRKVRNNISKIILIEVLILFVLIGAAVSNAQEVNSRSTFKVKPISLSVHLVRAVTTNDCYEIIQTKASTVVKEKAEADKKAEEAAKKKEEEKKLAVVETSYSGSKLTRSRGSIQGPSGKETYYNLNMTGVVSIMRRMGFSESEYPYNVRADGVKCLGSYVMVAAHLGKRPRGSKVQTSLGTGIVCDTGGFASGNPTQIDIATAW